MVTVASEVVQEPADRPRDADKLPTSSDPSGPCSHCGRVSNFTVVGNAPLTFDQGSVWVSPGGGAERPYNEQVAILECQGCGDRVVVIEERLVGGKRGGHAGAWSHRGLYWWPTPGATALDASVPTEVADAYSEGMRCLAANAPNGSVTMFRNAITYIVNDKGSAAAKAKGDLKEAIKQMANDGTLPGLAEWADHVRLYGNAGAHPDKFGPVAPDEAADVASLVRTMIELVYELPATIARRQAARRT